MVGDTRRWALPGINDCWRSGANRVSFGGMARTPHSPLSRRRAVCSLALVVLATVALPSAATGEVTPTNGVGNLTSTGFGSDGKSTFEATLRTEFTPAQIQPGQAFTFSVRRVVTHTWTSGYDPCNPGPSEQTFTHDTHGFGQVLPGEDAITDGTIADPTLNTDSYTYTDYATVDCSKDTGRAKTTSTQEYTATVPAGNSSLNAGCYQSIGWNNGHWFPGNGSTDGTIATLAVGECTSSDSCQSNASSRQATAIAAGWSTARVTSDARVLKLHVRCSECRFVRATGKVISGGKRLGRLRGTRARIRHGRAAVKLKIPARAYVGIADALLHGRTAKSPVTFRGFDSEGRESGKGEGRIVYKKVVLAPDATASNHCPELRTDGILHITVRHRPEPLVLHGEPDEGAPVKG